MEKSLHDYLSFLKNEIEHNHHSLVALEKIKKIMSELLGVPVNKHRRDARNPPFQKIPYTEIDKIELAGKSFVLSGVFIDSKTNVENYIENKGGYCKPRCTKSTDYLIVGGINDPAWTFSNYGRKIEKAVNYKTPIITEKRFMELMNDLK